MLGLHLDLKRPMPTMEYFERICRTAAALGMDTILLEVENKLRIERFRAAWHADAWDRRQVAQARRIAARHGLTIVPKVQLMGHMEWVLQWPQWAHLQENRDRQEICPSHPHASRFCADLLADILAWFPDSPVVHLGGDETRSLGTCDACRARGLERGQIYLEHFLPRIRQTEAAGRRAMIYGDMLLANPEVIDSLPRSVLIADWNYTGGTGELQPIWGYRKPVRRRADLRRVPQRLRWLLKDAFDDAGLEKPFPYLEALRGLGFETVALSSARCGGDNLAVTRTKFHVANALAGARRAAETGIAGTIVTSWAVRHNPFDNGWPSFAAAAWTLREGPMDLQDVSRRFAREFFGLDFPELFDVLEPLGRTLPHLLGESDHQLWPPDLLKPHVAGRLAGTDTDALLADAAVLARDAASAARTLRKRQRSVRRNRDAFNHYLLGADTLACLAEATPALLGYLGLAGRRPTEKRRARLLSEISRLKGRHRRLFGRQFAPASTDAEIRVRFEETGRILAV
jgi:hypothetical protein